jgi:uncharacterized protein (TIGR03086 family)
MTTSDVTTDIPTTYARLAAPFSAVVDRLVPADWDAASPCEGWCARDVLDHVVTTQRDFLAKHVHLGTAEPTGPGPGDPATTWHAHDAEVQRLLADPDVRDHAYDGVFGTTTVGRSLIDFYGFDLLVHRWDIAAAAGIDERLTDDELDVVDRSADGFGEHLYSDGVCKPALEPGASADRQERVLARLGRRGSSRA